MLRRRWAVVIGLGACLGLGLAESRGTAGVPVSGRVVDPSGEPVAGVRVATYWVFRDDVNTSGELEVDDQGAFSGSVRLSSRGTALVAYSDDRMLAGVVHLEAPEQEDGSIEGLELVVKPTVEVRAKVTNSDLGGDAGWWNSTWSSAGVRLVSYMADADELMLRLPATTYDYYAYDRYYSRVSGKVDLSDGEHADLGEWDFPGAYIAMNRGRVVEDWHVTEARGLALEDAHLSKLRGKWILLEFWGFW